jgi:hypothetical protein
MKRALYISNNLIGDALNISPAWRAWWALRQGDGYQVNLVTNPNQVAPLYSAMGVPVNVITDRSPDELVPRQGYDFVFNFDVSKAFELGIRDRLHITQAYAKMLGVEISSLKPSCLLDDAPYSGDDIEQGCILMSPFSVSCSSRSGKPPNKMLPVAAWVSIVDYLKQFARAIYVLGSSQDVEIPNLSLPRDSFLLGNHSLLEIARIMRDRAAMIVTIDNGMSHLAASQELPTLLFYPACLPLDWITPKGNPNCIPLQLDPTSFDLAHMLQTTKSVAPRLLEIKA